jgi:hypothetical protein
VSLLKLCPLFADSYDREGDRRKKNGLYLSRLLKEGSGCKSDTDTYATYKRIVVGLCPFFAQPTGTESVLNSLFTTLSKEMLLLLGPIFIRDCSITA